MNFAKIFKTLLPIITAVVLSGCGARASANVIINPDSTIQIEQLVLVEAKDGDQAVDLNTAPYNAIKPTGLDTYFEKREERSTTIDDVNYIGYYTQTKAMTLSEYSTFQSETGGSTFAPRIQIVKTGVPFLRIAKIDSTGLLDAYKEKYSLDGSSIKVNINVPGTVKESNQTKIDPDTGAYVWENEDCNNISITFRYFDMSSGAKKVLGVVVIVGYVMVGLAVLDMFTRPKKQNPAGASLPF